MPAGWGNAGRAFQCQHQRAAPPLRDSRWRPVRRLRPPPPRSDAHNSDAHRRAMDVLASALRSAHPRCPYEFSPNHLQGLHKRRHPPYNTFKRRSPPLMYVEGSFILSHLEANMSTSQLLAERPAMAAPRVAQRKAHPDISLAVILTVQLMLVLDVTVV